MSRQNNRNAQGAARPSALRQKSTGPKKMFLVSLDLWEAVFDLEKGIAIEVEAADEEEFLTANVIASDEDEARTIAQKLWKVPLARIRREVEEWEESEPGPEDAARARELVRLALKAVPS